MDYEKLHNLSLELGKKLIKENPELREWVESKLPELRESEDERIRKRLITLVEQFAQGAVKKPMLAYLEKQEQKPRWKINNPHTTIWTKEMIDEKFEELVDPKQGGWSKEDEMYLSQAIETLKHENYLILADKLKSIRPVKSAWSEEDEKIRKLLIWQVHRNIEDETNDLAQSVYDGIKGHDPDLEESIEDWKKCLAWLKSLPLSCPKSSDNWKPSEEQLNALNFAITYFMHETNYKNPTELRELYDDLLKLK